MDLRHMGDGQKDRSRCSSDLTYTNLYTNLYYSQKALCSERQEVVSKLDGCIATRFLLFR